MNDLAGRVALITGGGSGVGASVALALANEGVKIGLVGRSAAPLNDVGASLVAGGGEVHIAPADVDSLAEVSNAADAVTDSLGSIDVLVHAAGIGIYKPATELSEEEFQRTIATNLQGMFNLSRTVLPSMLERQRGHLIAISSGAGKTGYAGMTAYSASKFGLMGLMQSLAAEAGEHGVKVSTIVPGSILTDFGGRSAAEKRAATDGKRYLLPEDVSQAVLFLLKQSDRAWTQELNLWPI